MCATLRSPEKLLFNFFSSSRKKNIQRERKGQDVRLLHSCIIMMWPIYKLTVLDFIIIGVVPGKFVAERKGQYVQVWNM
jgi:hypothetical protein